VTGVAGVAEGVAGVAGVAEGVPFELDAVERWAVVDCGSAVAAIATTVMIEPRATTATVPTIEARRIRFIALLSVVEHGTGPVTRFNQHA